MKEAKDSYMWLLTLLKRLKIIDSPTQYASAHGVSRDQLRREMMEYVVEFAIGYNIDDRFSERES